MHVKNFLDGNTNSPPKSVPDVSRDRRARSAESKGHRGTRGVGAGEAGTVGPEPQARDRKTATRHAATPKRTLEVFINIPFHREYEPTLVALISGITAFGLAPRIVTRDVRSKHRLEKLIGMIQRSTCSFHDLSYVRLDGPERVPRFNMPFELGLAAGVTAKSKCFVLERSRYRLQQSLSDWNGVDPLIYNGTVAGIHRALLNVFDRRRSQIDVKLLSRVYREVWRRYGELRREYGAAWEGPCFARLQYLADRFLKDETEGRL